jgi:hypothetical protein
MIKNTIGFYLDEHRKSTDFDCVGASFAVSQRINLITK